MRFYLDEHIPKGVVEGLRRRDVNDAVAQAARAREARVERITPVRGSDHHHVAPGLQAVELRHERREHAIVDPRH